MWGPGCVTAHCTALEERAEDYSWSPCCWELGIKRRRSGWVAGACTGSTLVWGWGDTPFFILVALHLAEEGQLFQEIVETLPRLNLSQTIHIIAEESDSPLVELRNWNGEEYAS